jgi:hypothetical protein
LELAPDPGTLRNGSGSGKSNTDPNGSGSATAIVRTGKISFLEGRMYLYIVYGPKYGTLRGEREKRKKKQEKKKTRNRQT